MARAKENKAHLASLSLFFLNFQQQRDFLYSLEIMKARNEKGLTQKTAGKFFSIQLGNNSLKCMDGWMDRQDRQSHIWNICSVILCESLC